MLLPLSSTEQNQERSHSTFQQSNSAQATISANTDNRAGALWSGGEFLYGLA
jgi:hypothetical protein